MYRSVLLFFVSAIGIVAIHCHAQEWQMERKKFIKRELIRANASITDPTLRRYKFEKMAGSSFAFFRATAHLYYLDIAEGTILIPTQWKDTSKVSTWIQGDCHLQNVGFFDCNEQVFIALNDFDESYIAPFYWDTIRLLSSLFLMKEELGFKLGQEEAERVALDFLTEYRLTLEKVAGNNNEIDAVLDRYEVNGFVYDTLRKLMKKKSNEKLLKKWTVKVGGKRKFDLSNPKLAAISDEEFSEIRTGWIEYLSNTFNFPGKHPDSLKIKDCVARLYSGLGSLGSKKYYVLVEGESLKFSDDLILQIKEQRLPIMLTSAHKKALDDYNSRFKNHAARSKIAQRKMLALHNPLTGVLPGKDCHYLVSPISPWKFGYEGEDFTGSEQFGNFLQFTARALAYSHSRADRDSDETIDYSFEKEALAALSKWPNAQSNQLKISQNYADQVNRDYSIFLQLLKSGELK